MKKLIYMALLMSAITVTNMGCKGDQGPTGPAGPKGDQGIPGTSASKGDKGDTGSKGDKGDTGATGAANVIYSPWTQLKFTPFGTANGLTYARGAFSAPKLIQDILDRGVVLTYIQFDGAYIGILPFMQATPGGIFMEKAVVGNIDVVGTTNYSPDTRLYRYVLIPGGVPAGRMASLKSMSYQEVKAMYNLPD